MYFMAKSCLHLWPPEPDQNMPNLSRLSPTSTEYCNIPQKHRNSTKWANYAARLKILQKTVIFNDKSLEPMLGCHSMLQAQDQHLSLIRCSNNNHLGMLCRRVYKHVTYNAGMQ